MICYQCCWSRGRTFVLSQCSIVVCQLSLNRVATKQEKKSRSFPGFYKAINLLFHRLPQQKVNIIMTFIKGHSTSTPVHSTLADIYWAGSLLTEITMILFTQSTAVLCTFLNDKLKLHCLLQFLHRLHKIPWVFHVQKNVSVFQVCGHPVKWMSYSHRSNKTLPLFNQQYEIPSVLWRCW